MNIRVASYIIGSVVVLALTGCSANWDMQGNDPVEYYADHPIKNTIETRTQSYVAYFASSKEKLSTDEADRLRSQLHAISMAAVESVQMNVSKHDVTDEERKHYLAKLMRSIGYTKDNITFVSLPDASNNVVNIVVNYAVVVPPSNCPDWRRSPVTSYSNTTQGNFYCSGETNLGLMVADPHDLVSGTGDVEISTQRASQAVQNYNNSTPAASSAASSGSAASGSSGASSTGGSAGAAPPPQ